MDDLISRKLDRLTRGIRALVNYGCLDPYNPSETICRIVVPNVLFDGFVERMIDREKVLGLDLMALEVNSITVCNVVVTRESAVGIVLEPLEEAAHAAQPLPS